VVNVFKDHSPPRHEDTKERQREAEAGTIVDNFKEILARFLTDAFGGLLFVRKGVEKRDDGIDPQ
jgi:hypothetical protein